MLTEPQQLPLSSAGSVFTPCVVCRYAQLRCVRMRENKFMYTQRLSAGVLSGCSTCTELSPTPILHCRLGAQGPDKLSVPCGLGLELLQWDIDNCYSFCDCMRYRQRHPRTRCNPAGRAASAATCAPGGGIDSVQPTDLIPVYI
jgi:hypothetical protein